jgi:hypothetical protein
MEEHQIGWIAAIIIGGIAGWLAEQFHEERNGASDEHRARHRRGRCRQLAAGLPWYQLRWLARLFDRWFYRSLHPNRGRSDDQRRFSANVKPARPLVLTPFLSARRATASTKMRRPGVVLRRAGSFLAVLGPSLGASWPPAGFTGRGATHVCPALLRSLRRQGSTGALAGTCAPDATHRS